MAERGRHFHNVFSMSDAKELDLDDQERKGSGSTVRSGRPRGRVLRHSSQDALHYPRRAQSVFRRRRRQGALLIRNVPAGTYKVRGWHERIPSQTKEVVVPESGRSERRVYARVRRAAEVLSHEPCPKIPIGLPAKVLAAVVGFLVLLPAVTFGSLIATSRGRWRTRRADPDHG